MISIEPVATPGAPLARRNPVAKVAAALVFSFTLLATLDPVAPAIALGVELAVLPLFGIRYRVLARRAAPLLLSAVGVVATLVLFAADRSGRVLVDVGPVLVTSGVLLTALGLALRMLAVALPGVIVFATTDPTDLADALIQNAKAPARFAIGALAAFRLVPLLGQEWQMISMARRARGVDAGRNPWPGYGCSSRPRSRCWWGLSGAAPGSRWRWTPAVSTRAPHAPSPGGSGSGPPTAC